MLKRLRSMGLTPRQMAYDTLVGAILAALIWALFTIPFNM